MRVLRIIAIASLPALLLACDDPVESDQPPQDYARVIVGDLEQTVTFTPVVDSGGDFGLQSMLVNVGASPAVVEAIGGCCCLRLDTELQLDCMLGCPCWIVDTLAPADTLGAIEASRVHSPPGRYPLRVGQLVDPEVWVEVEVVVRSPRRPTP